MYELLMYRYGCWYGSLQRRKVVAIVSSMRASRISTVSLLPLVFYNLHLNPRPGRPRWQLPTPPPPHRRRTAQPLHPIAP